MKFQARSKAAPILAIALLWPASAATAGDADQAKGLIVEHCVDCHAVPGYGEGGSPAIDAPSFQEIADDAATYPEARMRRSLRQPHWPMSRLILSAEDIDNILAFIAQLKGEGR